LEEGGSEDPWISCGGSGLEEEDARFIGLFEEEVIEVDSELVGVDLGLISLILLAEFELEVEDVFFFSDELALGGFNGGSKVGDSVDD